MGLQVVTGPLDSRKWLWGKETRLCYSLAIIVDAYSVPDTVLALGSQELISSSQCLREELIVIQSNTRQV